MTGRDMRAGQIRRMPFGVGATNSWSEPEAEQWMVRGPEYLKQSGHMVLELKQPSKPAPYTCIGMNVFKSPVSLQHSSDKIMEFRRFLQENCDEDDDEGMPKYLVMCFLSSNFFKTEYYCVHQLFRRTAANRGEDPALDAAVARFMNADDLGKNEQFKYMFHVVESPPALTNLIATIGGERPILISRRLTTNYFRGKNYLEISTCAVLVKLFKALTELWMMTNNASDCATDMDLSSSMVGSMAFTVSGDDSIQSNTYRLKLTERNALFVDCVSKCLHDHL